MFARLRAWIDSVREGFWLIPVFIVAVTLGLVGAAVYFEADPFGGLLRLGGFEITADGARAILGMIGAGMITVVSLVFSLTFVALSLTSQQLGPRLLDYALRENVTQVLLGLALSTFLASAFGLTVIARDGQQTVPHGTPVAIALALAALTLLAVVQFAQRMANVMRADVTVAHIGDAFVTAVERTCGDPGAPDDAPAAEELFELVRREGRDIPAASSGYLSYVDEAGLAGFAERNGLRIAVQARENDYVIEGRPILRAVGIHAEDAEAEAKLRSAAMEFVQLTWRRQRTGFADFESDALVEVALRALSPGVNDPFTAMACLDRLAQGCAAMARSSPPRRVRAGEDGVALVATPSRGFAWLVGETLAPIVAAGDARVLRHATGRLADMRRVAIRAGDRRAVDDMLDRVARRAQDVAHDPADRDRILAAVEAAKSAAPE